jgi:hypothetical protein
MGTTRTVHTVTVIEHSAASLARRSRFEGKHTAPRKRGG